MRLRSYAIHWVAQKRVHLTKTERNFYSLLLTIYDGAFIINCINYATHFVLWAVAHRNATKRSADKRLTWWLGNRGALDKESVILMAPPHVAVHRYLLSKTDRLALFNYREARVENKKREIGRQVLYEQSEWIDPLG